MKRVPSSVAASRLGVSLRTAQRMIAAKKLPAFRPHETAHYQVIEDALPPAPRAMLPAGICEPQRQ